MTPRILGHGRSHPIRLGRCEKTLPRPDFVILISRTHDTRISWMQNAVRVRLDDLQIGMESGGPCLAGVSLQVLKRQRRSGRHPGG